MWYRGLEIAVDVYFLAFIVVVVSISKIDGFQEYVPISVIGMTIGILVSVSIWKFSCIHITDSTGAVTFHRKTLLKRLNIINFVMAFILLGLSAWAVQAAADDGRTEDATNGEVG